MPNFLEYNPEQAYLLPPSVQAMAERKIEAYVPDSHLGRELHRGVRVLGHAAARQPVHRQMWQKLRSPAGRAIYQRRKEIVEPVIGVLKEQRGMRRFRRRGLRKGAVELALVATAFNLTRLWRVAPQLKRAAWRIKHLLDSSPARHTANESGGRGENRRRDTVGRELPHSLCKPVLPVRATCCFVA